MWLKLSQKHGSFYTTFYRKKILSVVSSLLKITFRNLSPLHTSSVYVQLRGLDLLYYCDVQHFMVRMNLSSSKNLRV